LRARPNLISTNQGTNSNKFNENQTRIVTMPQLNPSLKEKPKRAPNFEFRPLDKDSLLGSTAETTREGQTLAQNIPATKTANVSKLVQPLERRYSPNYTNENRIQVTQVSSRHVSQSDKRQQAWQEWWSEKKKTNNRFLQACQSGDLLVCQQLLDKKRGDLAADINTKGENDWTPIHFACLNGNTSLVYLLISKEANIDGETSLKFTPLHITAQKGFEEIAQLLINAGADVNCKDIFNNTPLHYSSQNRHKRIVQILLSRPSIDLNSKNNEGKTAYDLQTDKEIKKLFEIYMNERNFTNKNYTQRVQIHTTQSESINKMFESIRTPNSQGAYGFYNKAPLSTNINNGNLPNLTLQKAVSDNTGTSKVSPKHKTGMSSNMGNEPRTPTYLRTSDSDLSNSGSGVEEEKIGPHSFSVHALIGKGSFGEVYLVEKKDTGKIYAMKVLHKSKITRHNLTRYALTERNVLSVTNHPFIVGLNFAFQTADKLFLILDYCPGGDLGEHLQKERRFSEERARIYLAEIVLALEDLHKRDIIFRDLKPDNIVLDPEGHAMLTDFGLSKEGVLEHAQGAGSFCGSVAYLAPEMLKRVGHGKAVDWYLLGVVFYEMLVGVPPYYANNREQLFYNIQKAALKIPSYLSQEAKSLLKGLLQRNPTKRLGSGKGDAEEIKAHKFFDSINWRDVYLRKLKPPVPDKKLKPTMRAPVGVFDSSANMNPDQDKINGWSFVAPKLYGQNENNLTSKLN